MKIVLQALISSFVTHLVYIVGQMIVSYIKTRKYEPDIASSWNEVEILQNEVVFGNANSPFIYLLTFIGVTVIYGIIIYSYKKLFH